MIEYRKHKSGRQFARIEGTVVHRVSNFSEMNEVTRINNAFTAEEILIDKDIYFPSTEQEFKEELQVALDRIQKMKV
jgi:hypothetical protein